MSNRICTSLETMRCFQYYLYLKSTRFSLITLDYSGLENQNISEESSSRRTCYGRNRKRKDQGECYRLKFPHAGYLRDCCLSFCPLLVLFFYCRHQVQQFYQTLCPLQTVFLTLFFYLKMDECEKLSFSPVGGESNNWKPEEKQTRARSIGSLLTGTGGWFKFSPLLEQSTNPVFAWSADYVAPSPCPANAGHVCNESMKNFTNEVLRK